MWLSLLLSLPPLRGKVPPKGADEGASVGRITSRTLTRHRLTAATPSPCKGRAWQTGDTLSKRNRHVNKYTEDTPHDRDHQRPVPSGRQAILFRPHGPDGGGGPGRDRGDGQGPGIRHLRAPQRPGGGRGGGPAPAPPGAPGHREGREAGAGQPGPGEGGLADLPAAGGTPRAGHEAGAGGVQLRRRQDHLLLHLRRPGGLPGVGEGSGGHLPGQDRASADRRAGRGPYAGGLRHLRQALLLLPVPQRVPARVHQDGENPEPVPEPHQDLGDLRAADVLFEVRAGGL